MARKAKAVGVQTASSAKAPSDPISGSVDQVINDSTSLSTSDETSRNEDTFTLSPSADLAEIKVNKWAQAELKTGTDDAVKQFFSSTYNQSHIHTDVKLGVGWTASIIALGASGYAYKIGYQESRSWVLLAVVVFTGLSAFLAVWQKYVEQNIVFQGSRKIFATSRIEKQSIEIRSNCLPYDPVYRMTVSHRHLTNGGKSLLRQFKKEIKLPFNTFFDDEGRLVRPELEKSLRSVMLEAQAGP